MRIIQHRVNTHRKPTFSNAVEIDVQLTDNGIWVLRHDFGEKSQWDCLAGYFGYLAHTYCDLLVNIKQALSVEQLRELKSIIGDRLLGFIDVPFPLAHYALTYCPIYYRLSEVEDSFQQNHCYWVDPLYEQKTENYEFLLRDRPDWSQLYIAMPSLHGADANADIEVFEWFQENKDRWMIQGVVTKYPLKLRLD